MAEELFMKSIVGWSMLQNRGVRWIIAG